MLEGHPMIRRLIVIDKDRWRRPAAAPGTVKELTALFRALRQARYDLVVDLQGLLRSGIMTQATQAPLRVGFTEAREGSRFFYTHKIRGGREVHAVDRYLKIAAALGCSTSEVVFDFPVREIVSERVNSIVAGTGEYIVIVPGARWETKIWLTERFGRLAAGLPVVSVVIGSASDKSRAGEIVRLSGGRAVSVAGETSLPDLVGLMRRAACVVTNDSGPMHIAAALDVPVVALFGPTSPLKTGPYGKRHVVLQSGRKCVPCFKRSCSHTGCMSDISVEAVLEKTLGFLLGQSA